MRRRTVPLIGASAVLAFGLAGCGTTAAATHTVRLGKDVYYNETGHRVSVGWSLMQVATGTHVTAMPTPGLPPGSRSALLTTQDGVAVRVYNWPQRYLPWSTAPGRVFGIMPPAWTFSAPWHGFTTGGRPVIWSAPTQTITVATAKESRSLHLPQGSTYHVSAAWVVSPPIAGDSSHPTDSFVMAYWPSTSAGWDPSQFWHAFFRQWIWLPQGDLSPVSGAFAAVPADPATWNAVLPIPTSWQSASWPMTPAASLHATNLQAWHLPNGLLGASARIPSTAGVTAALALQHWASANHLAMKDWPAPGGNAGGQWTANASQVWHATVMPDGKDGWLLWSWVAPSASVWTNTRTFADQWFSSVNWQATPPMGVQLYGAPTFTHLWGGSP